MIPPECPDLVWSFSLWQSQARACCWPWMLSHSFAAGAAFRELVSLYSEVLRLLVVLEPLSTGAFFLLAVWRPSWPECCVVWSVCWSCRLVFLPVLHDVSLPPPSRTFRPQPKLAGPAVGHRQVPKLSGSPLTCCVVGWLGSQAAPGGGSQRRALKNAEAIPQCSSMVEVLLLGCNESPPPGKEDLPRNTQMKMRRLAAAVI